MSVRTLSGEAPPGRPKAHTLERPCRLEDPSTKFALDRTFEASKNFLSCAFLASHDYLRSSAPKPLTKVTVLKGGHACEVLPRKEERTKWSRCLAPAIVLHIKVRGRHNAQSFPRRGFAASCQVNTHGLLLLSFLTRHFNLCALRLQKSHNLAHKADTAPRS
eukprot:3655398-Amphidinium_carterae.1